MEVVIQKSRFIGRCCGVAEEQAVLQMLADIKKKEWNASHHCYAYRLGADGGVARYSDDDEPGGTAGLPILEALRSKGVTNALCVVTRYFGGILLGTGGLARAYSRAASEAVDAAAPLWMVPCAIYAMVMDYSRWSSMEPQLRQYGKVLDVCFTEKVTVEMLIPDDDKTFADMVIQRSDGKVMPEKVGQRYSAFPINK